MLREALAQSALGRGCRCSRRGRRCPAGAHTWAVAATPDCAAVRAHGVHRGTHFAHCVRAVRTTAMSMLTKRAARATPWAGLAGRSGPVALPLARHKQSTGLFVFGARLLGAPKIAPAGHRLPRGDMVGSRREDQKRRLGLVCGCGCVRVFGICFKYQMRLRKGVWGQAAARLWCAEKHRACGLARSAIRNLTRRGCSNGANPVSKVSSATGRKTEHRRAVGRSTDRTSEALIMRTVSTRLCRDQLRTQEREQLT